MEFTVRRETDGTVVVTCPPRMEWDARGDVAAALSEYSPQTGCPLIIDLQDVVHMNSAGIGAIFLMVYQARKGGAPVAVVAANPTIARLLRTVNLPALAVLAPTAAEALAALAAEKSLPKAAEA